MASEASAWPGAGLYLHPFAPYLPRTHWAPLSLFAPDTHSDGRIFGVPAQDALCWLPVCQTSRWPSPSLPRSGACTSYDVGSLLLLAATPSAADESGPGRSLPPSAPNQIIFTARCARLFLEPISAAPQGWPLIICQALTQEASC